LQSELVSTEGDVEEEDDLNEDNDDDEYIVESGIFLNDDDDDLKDNCFSVFPFVIVVLIANEHICRLWHINPFAMANPRTQSIRNVDNMLNIITACIVLRKRLVVNPNLPKLDKNFR
jgi:hypothetical protein